MQTVTIGTRKHTALRLFVHLMAASHAAPCWKQVAAAFVSCDIELLVVLCFAHDTELSLDSEIL